MPNEWFENEAEFVLSDISIHAPHDSRRLFDLRVLITDFDPYQIWSLIFPQTWSLISTAATLEMTDAQIEEFIKKADKNGDAMIDFREFESLVSGSIFDLWFLVVDLYSILFSIWFLLYENKDVPLVMNRGLQCNLCSFIFGLWSHPLPDGVSARQGEQDAARDALPRRRSHRQEPETGGAVFDLWSLLSVVDSLILDKWYL